MAPAGTEGWEWSLNSAGGPWPFQFLGIYHLQDPLLELPLIIMEATRQ